MQVECHCCLVIIVFWIAIANMLLSCMLIVIADFATVRHVECHCYVYAPVAMQVGCDAWLLLCMLTVIATLLLSCTLAASDGLMLVCMRIAMAILLLLFIVTASAALLFLCMLIAIAHLLLLLMLLVVAVCTLITIARLFSQQDLTVDCSLLSSGLVLLVIR